MSYFLLINPQAQLEIEKAHQYYSKISSTVADNFYNALQEAYNSLEINPYFQIRIKNYRALPLNKFPFLIFFEIFEQDKKVKIYGVFNTNQNPSKYPS